MPGRKQEKPKQAETQGQSSVDYVEILPAQRVEGATEIQWYWNAMANNGEVVATSELYTDKSNAVRAAEDVFPEVEIRHPDETKTDPTK